MEEQDRASQLLIAVPSLGRAAWTPATVCASGKGTLEEQDIASQLLTALPSLGSAA